MKDIHTKDIVLKHAIELFAKEGYDGLRMDDLASYAKVNKATIYYYFKNKKTLYESIIRDLAKSFYENMHDYLKDKKSAKEKLEGFLDGALYFIQTHRDIAKIMMTELSFEWKNISLETKETFMPIISTLKDILNEGIKSDDFHKINPLLLQGVLVGGFNYYLIMKKIYSNIESSKKINIELSDGKDEVKQMILKSLIKGY